MPPKSWADHWVTVFGRSPGPGHCVTQPHCCLHVDQYRRIVASPSPHRAMPSGVISPMPPDCSARLRSLLYDYQGREIGDYLCPIVNSQPLARWFPTTERRNLNDQEGLENVSQASLAAG